MSFTVHPDEPCRNCGARETLRLHPDGSIASAYHDCAKGPPGPPNPPRFFPPGKFQPRPGAVIRQPLPPIPAVQPHWGPGGNVTALNILLNAVHVWRASRPGGGDDSRITGRAEIHGDAADALERAWDDFEALKQGVVRSRDERVAAGKSLREAAAEAGMTPVELGQIERKPCGAEYRGFACELGRLHWGPHKAIVHGSDPMVWTDDAMQKQADARAGFWGRKKDL